MKIPFSPPDIGKDEIESVTEVLKTGWITTGPKTKLLEKKIGEYCHTGQAVCLNSQTACAEMTLRVLRVGPGDDANHAHTAPLARSFSTTVTEK